MKNSIAIIFIVIIGALGNVALWMSVVFALHWVTGLGVHESLSLLTGMLIGYLIIRFIVKGN